MYRFLVLLSFLLIISCKYENIEEKYPPPPVCDTDSVKYSLEVSQIIAANCIGCHSGPNPQGQLDLSTYDNVMTNAPSIRDRINRPAGASGVMPEGGKLNDCDLKTFNAWIDAGAPNN